jgi:hypothetical protein
VSAMEKQIAAKPKKSAIAPSARASSGNSLVFLISLHPLSGVRFLHCDSIQLDAERCLAVAEFLN